MALEHLERELDVVRRKRLPVVPMHLGVQGEGQLVKGRVVLPARRQPGLDFALSVIGVEEEFFARLLVPSLILLAVRNERVEAIEDLEERLDLRLSLS